MWLDKAKTLEVIKCTRCKKRPPIYANTREAPPGTASGKSLPISCFFITIKQFYGACNFGVMGLKRRLMSIRQHAIASTRLYGHYSPLSK